MHFLIKQGKNPQNKPQSPNNKKPTPQRKKETKKPQTIALPKLVEVVVVGVTDEQNFGEAKLYSEIVERESLD